MVLAARDGVQGLDWGEEVTWDKLGALVDELVEGVLTVGTTLSPDDGLRISALVPIQFPCPHSLQSRS